MDHERKDCLDTKIVYQTPSLKWFLYFSRLTVMTVSVTRVTRVSSVISGYLIIYIYIYIYCKVWLVGFRFALHTLQFRWLRPTWNSHRQKTADLDFNNPSDGSVGNIICAQHTQMLVHDRSQDAVVPCVFPRLHGIALWQSS